MKRGLYFFLIISLLDISCNNEIPVVSPALLHEIKTYIETSEEYDNQTGGHYSETDVYLVKFYQVDDQKYIFILENNFYFKEDLEGYFRLGDNKIFIYKQNSKFINYENLLKDLPSDIPNEHSISGAGFNSKELYLKINPDLTLTKIEDDEFRLNWFE